MPDGEAPLARHSAWSPLNSTLLPANHAYSQCDRSDCALSFATSGPKAYSIQVVKNKPIIGAVAQLVAHLHGMQRVRGSSPLSSTKKLKRLLCGSFLFFIELRIPESPPYSYHSPASARLRRSRITPARAMLVKPTSSRATLVPVRASLPT